jgi:hypothetical protein
MSTHPADFRVEIIKGTPQAIRGIAFSIFAGVIELELQQTLDTPGEVVDVTQYVERGGFGSINRAVERDFQSFKTGDLTLTLNNPAGYFDDLFAYFGTDDTWGLRVFRRGEIQFYGLLIGKGSISFLRKTKSVEVTIYGLTKLLDLTSAELVRRAFPIFTVTTANATNLTLTMNDTQLLLSGDVLHLTNHVDSEDVTVKQVTSGTVVALESALVHTYAAGLPVEVTTKFRRYKSIDFLVEYLFRAAFIGMAEIRLSNSQFSTLAPTPVNLSGLPTFATTNPIYTCPSERNDREYATLLVNGTFYQETPDAAWVNEDATVRAWVDWSPYFLETDSGPSFLPRTPETAEATGELDPHACGWDLRGSTQRMYMIQRVPGNLQVRTSTDGTTWAAAVNVATPTIPLWSTAQNTQDIGCEYDPVRDQVLVWSSRQQAGNEVIQLYDVGGGTWTDLTQGDEGGFGYGGFTYCRDLDCFIGLLSNTSSAVGPDFDIVAFRGTSRLWRRSFPGVLVQENLTTARLIYPTHSLRFIKGKLYCIVISDGVPQLVVSPDQFVTYTIRPLGAAGTGVRTFGARVKGAYVTAAYLSTLQRNLLYAAPFYAGVIPYADFEGLSAAEALKKLAVLCNALFWVDDDLQGHFVARDLYDPGSVADIGPRVMDRKDDVLWDEISRFVSVSGGGFEAVSGDNSFAAEGIDIESSFIPNAAFAQSLADAYAEFYRKARAYVEAPIHDVDGRIYRPLDRVTLGGPERYLVYESDHSLMDDEVQLTLLEDR